MLNKQKVLIGGILKKEAGSTFVLPAILRTFAYLTLYWHYWLLYP
jgi:hypothetical protein